MKRKDQSLKEKSAEQQANPIRSRSHQSLSTKRKIMPEMRWCEDKKSKPYLERSASQIEPLQSIVSVMPYNGSRSSFNSKI